MQFIREITLDLPQKFRKAHWPIYYTIQVEAQIIDKLLQSKRM